MIKPSDLRIGNHVYGVSDRIETVAGLGETTISAYAGKIKESVMTFNCEGFSPIPLTEQWLIDFGAEKEPLTLSFDISRFNNEYKRLVIDAPNRMIGIRNGEKSGRRDKDELIVIFNGDVDGDLFVHDLQNIYFWLKREELIAS